MHLVITTSLITTNNADVLKPAIAYLASQRSDVGRRNMASSLNRVARIIMRNADATWQDVNWLTLDAANVQAIVSQLSGAPATINLTLAALRGVARSAFLAGLMDVDTYQRIRLVKGAKGSREATGRDIEGWEIAALMRTCAKDKSAAGARDAAMIAMAAKTGARREELASIQLSDMTKTADGYEITVIGKGNKERVLFVDNGALKALADWLTVRGESGNFLFVQVTQTGSVLSDTSLSTTAMHKILVKRSTEAGVSNIGWHDFRRTVAGELLNVGEDISTVAQILGHSDVRTTARYDRRPAEARRKAARKISVPYFGRN